MRAKNIRYIHGVGIDLRKYKQRNAKDRNSELRLKLGIPLNAKVLLSVGELNINKNHGVVIRGIEQLQKWDVYYVICGDGILKEYYKRLAENLGIANRFILAGFCNNVQDYYRMADVFCLPSFREGIPSSIMEAMAMGIPVIASNIRGIRDIIMDYKYLFNPHDVVDLVKTIKMSLTYYPKSIIEQNIRMLRCYEFNYVVTELMQVYSLFSG